MSQNAFCKDFTKLYTLLVEAVYVPQESLEHDLILEVCKQCSQRLRIYLISDDDAGRTAAFKVFVFILICFTAGKCNDLSCYVCAEFLLAGAALDVDIGLHLVIAEAYKLQRNDISSLMQQLIERMLSVGTWLAEENRTGRVIDRLAEAVDRFTVGLHIYLL